MSTLTEVSDLIDLKYGNASDITSVDQRSLLKDDQDSMLNASYGNVINDTDATQTTFSITTPGSIQFKMQLVKQGREVSVNMEFKTNQIISQIGSIVSGELTTTTNGTYYATGWDVSNDVPIGIEIRWVGGVTSLFTTNVLPVNASVKFNLVYNTNA